MSVWVRFLANPKLLGRFLKTKAGRKAAFKWGGMLVKSRAAQSLIDKFINRNGKRLNKDKSYRDLEKKYENIQKRIAELEKQFEKSHESQCRIRQIHLHWAARLLKCSNYIHKCNQNCSVFNNSK